MSYRWIFVGSVLLAACATDDEPRAPADAIPASANAVSGNVTVGTVGMRHRESVGVTSVKLTQAPITVHDYRRCVEAGVCSAPSRTDLSCTAKGLDGATWTATPEKREGLPLTCATADQAAKYCRWVGGRLPRIDEWMLAARGTDVHRYPWGDSPPTCAQVMRLQFRSPDPTLCCGGSCGGDGQAVGKHAAGRGAGVLDDVLLSRGEYVTGLTTKETTGCNDGQTCVVRGGTPSAIEQVMPSGTTADLEAAGFRCAWGVR